MKVYVVHYQGWRDFDTFYHNNDSVYLYETDAIKAVEILKSTGKSAYYKEFELKESIVEYETTRIELGLYIPENIEAVSLDDYYSMEESTFTLLLPPRQELYYLSEPLEESWDKFGYSEGYIYIDVDANNEKLISKVRGIMHEIVYKFTELVTFDKEGFCEIDYAELEKVINEANKRLKEGK